MFYRDYLKNLLGEEFQQQFDDECEKFFKSVENVGEGISFILRTHLFVENQLNRFIRTILPSGNKLLRDGHLTFNQKLLIVQSFDLIDLQILDLTKKLNEVRNNIAHDISYEVNDQTIEKLGKPLGKFYTQKIKGEYFSKFEADIEGRNVTDVISIKLMLMGEYFR